MIQQKGYTIELVSAKIAAPDLGKKTPWKAPWPDVAPKFFLEAFSEARHKRRPIIIDFWASWCGPCLQLKKVTFANEHVKPLLEQCQVIYVDLDNHPKLAELYGVAAIPDVLLINRDGLVVDRFQNFEPPERFRMRVLNLLTPEPERREASQRLKGAPSDGEPNEN